MVSALLAIALLAFVSSCATSPRPAILAPHIPSHGDYIVLPPPAYDPAPPSQVINPPIANWNCEGYRPWRHIVVHHSATPGGNAEQFDHYHRTVRGWDELGYHFVITNGQGAPDGQVQVGSRWKVQKWGAHTGGTPDNEYNEYGIGICLVGDFSSSMPTQAQLDSLVELLDYLAARYGISKHNIIGHRDAPGANTQCPGDAFWTYMREELNLGR